ncbi:MAG: hypothetical protein HN868_18925 [Gammaproteobacteria bacterium]|nr:hypothetical protein [Gammaproteobacteria bacterium]
MDNKLTLDIKPELSDLIDRVRSLNEVVIQIEDEAKKVSRKIDYSNFPEYTELHNLYTALNNRLAASACLALGLSTIR